MRVKIYASVKCPCKCWWTDWASGQSVLLVGLFIISLAAPLGCTGGAVSSAVLDSNELAVAPSIGVTNDGNQTATSSAGQAPATTLFSGRQLVMYWGQSTAGSSEPELAQVCQDANYDVIVLAFVHIFGRNNSQNQNAMPGSNFAGHCTDAPDSKSPSLLVCPSFTAGINACQANNKRVLISMGGADGAYGFADDADAIETAQAMWDLYLGGSAPTRPFGTAVLDGVDLDIERGNSTFYTAFVTKMRALMDADPKRYYAITGAPQCVYPDAWLGPNPGTALTDVPSFFDALFVQFYNNDCGASTPQTFKPSWVQWADVAKKGEFKLFVGIPSSKGAASGTSFVTTNNLPALFSGIKNDEVFGGAMMWDVANDKANQGIYGQTVKKLLQIP